MTRSSASPRTTRLATARLELRDDRRLTRALLLTVAAALVILSILVGSQTYVDDRESGSELTELRREKATLQADLARARTELGLERSTRAALVRQVAELNEEKTQLESRLEFFNAQSGRTGRAP